MSDEEDRRRVRLARWRGTRRRKPWKVVEIGRSRRRRTEQRRRAARKEP